MDRTSGRTMPAIKKIDDAAGLCWCPETPLPVLGPRDVLIAVTAAGICGTDRHIWQWDAWSRSRVPLGITIGHEFVGRVVAVGAAVGNVQIGQRVTAEGHIGCGRCQPCRTGNAHICQRVDILGIDRDGCFAPHVAVPEENIWPVHADIPDRVAAVLDPLGNAVHTVMAAGVAGRSVLITGAGTIGLMAVGVARAAGATRILVSDLDRSRLELARRLGADEAYPAEDEDWPQQARRATRNQGPHVLLEMSGSEQAIRQGFAALAGGGVAALLGLPAEPVAFDLPNEIIFKGLTLLGINGRRMFQSWYQMESFLLAGRLDLEPIITHQLDLHDFERAFGLLESGQAIKVILNVPQADTPLCPMPTSTSAAASYSPR